MRAVCSRWYYAGGRRDRIKISPSILTTANLPYYLNPFSANNRRAKLISCISYNEKQTRRLLLRRDDGSLIARFFEKPKPPPSLSFFLFFPLSRFHFTRLVKIDTGREEWGINRGGRGKDEGERERKEKRRLSSLSLFLPEEFEIAERGETLSRR